MCAQMGLYWPLWLITGIQVVERIYFTIILQSGVGRGEVHFCLNEIECDHAGVVTRVLVQDGESVEYGQPLFEIE